MENGQTLGSTDLLRLVFELALEDGLRSIECWQKLSRENKLTLSQEERQNIMSALHVLDSSLPPQSKWTTWSLS